LIADGDSPVVRELASGAWCQVEYFGLRPEVKWRAVNIKGSEQGTRFEVLREGALFGHFFIPLVGDFNVRNCLAVIATASALGVQREAIARACASFKSVKRRMEVRGEVNGVVVIDDFAHHPTAVRATLAAVKEKYPGRRIVAIFEPRSRTSRLRMMQRPYEEALVEADYVIIAPLFRPEVVSENERLSPEELAQNLRQRGREAYALPAVPLIVSHLAERLQSGDVVVIMSNGNFGGVHDKLLEKLKSFA